jgi:hypothetical protein
MSRSALKRFVPAAIVAAASACIYYGCVENPIPPGRGGGGDTDSTITNPGDSGKVITTGKTVDELLKDGHAALKKEWYDDALAYYEAAYKQNNNHQGAIVYSTLAKIASISVEPKVIELIKTKIGFTEYPNKLNALISTDWMTNFQEEHFDRGYWDENIDEYVNWYSQSEVNRGEYPGVTKEGYYYNTHTGYTFVSSTPRYEDQLVWSYYDETSEKYARWFDDWDVRYGGYPGVNKVGYYNEDYNYNNGQWSYVFVSSTPRYETNIVGYHDNASNKWVFWMEEWAVEAGYVSKVGYYYDNYTYTFVTSQKKDAWMENNYLPNLIAPNWVKGGSNSMYSNSLLDGAPTMETWPLLLFANLLDKNTSGLNSLLDATIDAVFGAAFNEACTRVTKLKNKPAIKLDSEFIAALSLEDFADEFDEIGWAEVNALTSVMTGIKASLEWVAAYNWDTKLDFMKFAWGSTEDSFFDSLKVKLSPMSVTDLPFRNNFLKERSGKMAAAKTDFVKAITGLRDSYTEIIANPLYPSAVRDPYPTLKEGADLLIAAINGNKVFYIPDDPTKGRWPTSGNGIDMGKIFTGGYFSLQNLFETESNGTPVFYVDGTKLTTSNYASKIDGAGYAALKFKTSRVTSVVVGFDVGSSGDVEIDIPARLAKLAFEKYNGRTLTKSQAAQLAKANLRK